MAKDMHYPSYLSCVADILSSSETPLSVDTLVARIEAQRPVGGGVRSAIYQAINKLYQAIPVDSGRYGWLSCLLKNQRFRHPLSHFEVQRGYLLLDELEHAVFFPQFFQAHQTDARVITVDLMGGPSIQVQATVEQGTWSLHLGEPFVKWVDRAGGVARDDLLIWVVDAMSGQYSARLQPREARQEDEIHTHNILLARTAEEIVNGDRKARDAVPVWELAAALIGRGVFTHDIPPDDMHYVLHEHSNLRLFGDVGYAFRERQNVARRGSRSDEMRPSAAFSEAPSWIDPDLMGSSGGEEPWDEAVEDDFDAYLEDAMWNMLEGSDGFVDDVFEHCEGYEAYLAEFRDRTPEEQPLSHMEFHLLEAELEMLVGLEQEFGYLMPEQEERKMALAAQLFIDLDFYFGDDWGPGDYDDPPFWEN